MTNQDILKPITQVSSSITIIKNTTSDVYEIFVQIIDLEIEVGDVAWDQPFIVVQVSETLV